MASLNKGSLDWPSTQVREWTVRQIEAPNRERFCEIAEWELLSLHPGNCARYRVTLAEFSAWQKIRSK